ncbi:MAG: bifunctional 4-hydroxy-2-oxoglutarate aldolase/2-dehydro-3-deoxy-phosphogluconate aldolase [Verrucomicrobiaceae bacterium]|nr:MAG: bifunctional 4-hydroxy-2-oxoglutarate aldolase/2-dehydro-3-deoxy-phosphogluconate aldolase [Verrucomicrobiaceae bacterium]
MFNETLRSHLQRSGVVAVLVIDDSADAVPAARALLAGGVDCMELTLRTPAAMEALQRIRGEVPEMLAGVGTILTPEQVGEVAAAGASFGVAPGMNPRVVTEAKQVGLPFAPGICTPSDIEAALECGCRVLKFFPAEPLGGIGYLKSIAAPYAHLGLSFIPLGGVDAGNAESYLREPNILALGGSWIAPRDLIRKRDWLAITQRAGQVAEIVKKTRL